MLGDSNNINKYNWNLVVLKKIGKTFNNYHFFTHLHKKGVTMGHTQNTKTFFAEITKPDHKLSKTFYFIKISHVLAELCFSVLYDA